MDSACVAAVGKAEYRVDTAPLPRCKNEHGAYGCALISPTLGAASGGALSTADEQICSSAPRQLLKMAENYTLHLILHLYIPAEYRRTQRISDAATHLHFWRRSNTAIQTGKPPCGSPPDTVILRAGDLRVCFWSTKD